MPYRCEHIATLDHIESAKADDYTYGHHPQVDAVARDGVTTPLLLAVVGGHTAVVRALLWRGARAAGAAPNAWGPLHAAAACNRLGIMEMLLQLGASAGVVDARSGQLPEDAARRRGHARAAELLSAFRAATA